MTVWQLTEPGTPPPDKRVEALRRLTELGIPCGVLVAPVLPGLSDSEQQLGRSDRGARRGRGGVGPRSGAPPARAPCAAHYLDWLAGVRPDLMALHRRRFRRGAYQDDEERERIEGIVRRAALRVGVTGRDRYRAEPRQQSPSPTGGVGHDGEQRARNTQLQLL